MALSLKLPQGARMNRVIRLGGTAALAVGLAWSVGCGKREAAGGAAAAEKTSKLTYSGFFPPMHVQAKAAMDWAQESKRAPAAGSRSRCIRAVP
jgi:hypothetical protein